MLYYGGCKCKANSKEEGLGVNSIILDSKLSMCTFAIKQPKIFIHFWDPVFSLPAPD